MASVQGKKSGGKITRAFLAERSERCMKAGYPKQKWIVFCENLIEMGFSLRLYEARQTFSKYVTVIRGHKTFKVRFSNHKPIKDRELAGDCDFFVGITHTGTRTTDEALVAVQNYFNEVKANV